MKKTLPIRNDDGHAIFQSDEAGNMILCITNPNSVVIKSGVHGLDLQQYHVRSIYIYKDI